MGIPFIKGHGTQNDFVVLPDIDGELELTATKVATLCDRRAGVGADGVLRVVRAAALGEPLPQDVPADAMFMDYRNADGSIAEMCGNGVRVFAAHLADAGLLTPGDFAVGTRAGLRRGTVHPDGLVTVHMGVATVSDKSTATVEGVAYEGLAVDVGNPHLVCPVDVDLAELYLKVPPGHDPAVFPHGVNVEFITELDEYTVRMRVHERGVGETLSCGTGTVAVTAAVLHAAGQTEGVRDVLVPGGQVRVSVSATGCTLTGPAELVARGELDEVWWHGIA
ncbi:diaminopimelate epimerase [Pseudonocardiaceae bacterium YIM PH 21723]|nr:diaminopimelate epimerase [Pseudonocardiaceae bacterium YIM PH 21723]